jgi:hypothetical protein
MYGRGRPGHTPGDRVRSLGYRQTISPSSMARPSSLDPSVGRSRLTDRIGGKWHAAQDLCEIRDIGRGRRWKTPLVELMADTAYSGDE